MEDKLFHAHAEVCALWVPATGRTDDPARLESIRLYDGSEFFQLVSCISLSFPM